MAKLMEIEKNPNNKKKGFLRQTYFEIFGGVPQESLEDEDEVSGERVDTYEAEEASPSPQNKKQATPRGGIFKTLKNMFKGNGSKGDSSSNGSASQHIKSDSKARLTLSNSKPSPDTKQRKTLNIGSDTNGGGVFKLAGNKSSGPENGTGGKQASWSSKPQSLTISIPPVNSNKKSAQK